MKRRGIFVFLGLLLVLAPGPARAEDVRSAEPLEEETRAVRPLAKFVLPPLQPARPARNLANRTLVLTDVDDELEAGFRFSRARFEQLVTIAPFPPLVQDTTRRVEEWTLSWRHRLARNWDATVEVPYVSARETQPSRVPAAATRQEDVQEISFREDGIGDARLRVSRQLATRLEPLRSVAIDLGAKLDTGASDFPAGSALLAPGTGQTDVTFGVRAKQELGGFTGSLRLERAWRGEGERKASDGTRLVLDPADEWRYGARADKAFRRWLVGSFELGGFTAGGASRLLTVEPSVTVSVTDDLEAVVYGRLPVSQDGEPSDGSYGFLARWRI